ncbi:MAG TPA: hypothetical protein VEI28_02615 [Thermodesulfovibrionales bacterium]|nr:hypothetical protein [Thermodesulfovibrionales bacterium]
MFEHYREKLIDRDEFISRLLRHLLFASVILVLSLCLGTVGYRVFGKLQWIDAFLNASMILTGMGPVDHVETYGGKLFSACYALFSGVAFLTFVGVLFAPIYHRFLHRFHLSIEDEDTGGE